MKKTFLGIAMATVIAVSGFMGAANVGAAGSFSGNASVDGGGISADLQLIPNGIAGGIGIAGGEADGAYSGGWIFNGSGNGFTGVSAGGFTDTNAYTYTPGGTLDIGIGVGSKTESIATTEGVVNGGIKGLGLTGGTIDGEVFQGTLNSSTVGTSPLGVWDSNGNSTGTALQGSTGEFAGIGGAVFNGKYDIKAGIDMGGISYSNSYRGIDFTSTGKTEAMGTNVGIVTEVTSFGSASDTGFGAATVDGGFIAGGSIEADTTQSLTGGNANASLNTGYIGSGSLGQTLNADAFGATQTSATTINGYNGEVMSAQSGTNVSITVTQ